MRAANSRSPVHVASLRLEDVGQKSRPPASVIRKSGPCSGVSPVQVSASDSSRMTPCRPGSLSPLKKLQPRPIKHAGIGFRVAPGGPAVAGRPPRACRRSRGWGRSGGTLGGPAVGDSGPPPGPDRRAPKQANISSLTGLYTAFQSAPPRALRHGRPSGT